MEEKNPVRAAFTLRFRNPRIHNALRVTADLMGVPMSEIAEHAIERELVLLGAGLQETLERAVGLLRDLRPSHEAAVEAFAEAEVSHPDPMKSRHAGDRDPFGVGDIFARAMG
jgi:hypothetical protein